MEFGSKFMLVTIIEISLNYLNKKKLEDEITIYRMSIANNYFAFKL